MAHMYPFYSAPLATAQPVPALEAHNCTLIVRQQPTEALVSLAGKEKARKPIDPPPIIELKVNNPQDPHQQWLQCPYFFVAVHLLEGGTTKRGEDGASGPLIGTLVSSLHRLKDNDNKDGGFFIFADISSIAQGTFRLRFNLFEMQNNATLAVFLGNVDSDEFSVVAAKDFKGMAESTVLSRSFSDQGVRLRLRKEPRGLSGNKRKFDTAKDDKEQPRRTNMIHDPSSSFEDSSSPNKRVKDDVDERKDSHADHSQPHMATPTYPTHAFGGPLNFTQPGHAIHRQNTLPSPAMPQLTNWALNPNVQGAYQSPDMGLHHYQPRTPITNNANLYGQQTYQTLGNGTMANSLPHGLPQALPQHGSYQNDNYHYPLRRVLHEVGEYPTFLDGDFGAQPSYPHNQ
ncbi:hypothetical protein ACEQ8H_006194 [Pleosporales sp. CAS-2024a]